MLKNSASHYGWISIGFHWLSAAVVLVMLPLGLWMVELDYYDAWYHRAPALHKSLGMCLLAVSLLRSAWALISPTPPPLSAKPWEQLAAKAGHYGLYGLLFLLVASGYLISTADGRPIEVFDWFAVPSAGQLFEAQEDIAGELHQALAYGLILLLAIHIGAALKHHFFDKDATLRRILKPGESS